MFAKIITFRLNPSHSMRLHFPHLWSQSRPTATRRSMASSPRAIARRCPTARRCKMSSLIYGQYTQCHTTGLQNSCGTCSQSGASRKIRRRTYCEKTNPRPWLYTMLLGYIAKEKCAGMDETGVYINKTLCWFWCLQCARFCFVFTDPSRGMKVLKRHGILEHLSNLVLRTDRHSTCFNLDVLTHQFCLVNLLLRLMPNCPHFYGKSFLQPHVIKCQRNYDLI